MKKANKLEAQLQEAMNRQKETVMQLKLSVAFSGMQNDPAYKEEKINQPKKLQKNGRKEVYRRA